MSRSLTVLCLLLLLPARGPAEAKAPEQLLAADSVIYLRFDGLDSHRKAYEQTALGEVMKGDLGRLFDYSLTAVRDSLGPVLVKSQLLEGASADRLKFVRKGFTQFPAVFEFLGQHGAVLGVEASGLPVPGAQVTVVFPGADAKHREALFALFQLAAALAESHVKEEKVEGRTVFAVEARPGVPVRTAWWQEGDHVVFVVGTGGPAHTIRLADGKRPGLAENPLYKSLAGFKAYETFARGFVDFERIRKLAAPFGPQVNKVITTFGLEHLRKLTMQFGFEGRMERSTIVFNLAGPRKGLLGLFLPPERFALDQLPPIPPDATTIQVSNLDLARLYDLTLQAIEGVVEVANPEAKEEVAGLPRKIDQALGIDLRKDLLGELGPLTVIYNSPSEGVASLGYGVALKVKDAAKVRDALQAMFPALAASTGAPISVKKQAYRGADVHTVRVAQQGFFFMPSYAIHNDWLVVGMFPQTVHGFILRSGGKYETWKPTALAREAVTAAGKAGDASGTHTAGGRIISVSVSDPRPSIKQLCSIGPFIAGLVNSFAPGSFDVGKIPNGQAVTEPLFPNVSVTIEEGGSMRMESYASVSLPFDLVGLDSFYATLFGFSLLRFGAF